MSDVANQFRKRAAELIEQVPPALLPDAQDALKRAWDELYLLLATDALGGPALVDVIVDVAFELGKLSAGGRPSPPNGPARLTPDLDRLCADWTAGPVKDPEKFPFPPNPFCVTGRGDDVEVFLPAQFCLSPDGAAVLGYWLLFMAGQRGDRVARRLKKMHE